ncbi:membrane dipeptidase [Balneolaceae bacterium YR4-1]|uniref:Membrane dipeptidase n=1 Tax=Halalkalibaculum roseum TaxID=2709311 RepID=A0A6M1T0V2_9BACT|nr:dipeptidase [Halalkalibaculum roseum]NGP76377.1 membrane dipeptidase [Halalkalibaculum roseum]
MKKWICGIFLIFISISATCTTQTDYSEKASELVQNLIIVDTHVDVPYRLKNSWANISEQTESGDFDYVRAKKGGLDAPFMSIYIPAEYQETGGAKAVADSLIDMVRGIAEDNPEKFAIATSPEQIKEQHQKDLISLPMGMENGAPIGQDLENISYFFDRGIRYITLTHSKDNQISDSSYDTTYTHNGLSDFGEEVIKEMNRIGMMVDISHVSDSAFFDVMDITRAPAIASHSSARHFTPGFERNMSDAMIEKLAENGGVIMINFGSTFLDSESRESSSNIREHIGDWLEENDLEQSDSTAQAYIETYRAEHFKYSNVSKVADHIDHVVNLVGIDHVGLGSDYDGVGDTLPVGLKDVSEYPNLIEELLRRGYTESEIRQICSENIFRVWNEVTRVATEMNTQ